MGPAADCDLCSGLASERLGVVCGRGALPGRLILIGEAPSVNGSNITGSPFVGDRSGRVLKYSLQTAGLSTVPMYITNVVKCALPRNATPGRIHVANCRRFLVEELEASPDALLVPLGRVAVESVLGRRREKMLDLSGRPTRSREGRVVFPMVHPAYVVRGAYALNAYVADFRRLAMLVASREGG